MRKGCEAQGFSNLAASLNQLGRFKRTTAWYADLIGVGWNLGIGLTLVREGHIRDQQEKHLHTAFCAEWTDLFFSKMLEKECL